MNTHKPVQTITKVAILICTMGAIFYCYEYLLRITPSVMAQPMMQYFQINAASFGTLSALYYFSYTPMQVPVGVLVDRFGARFLLTFACFFCALGSYLFANELVYISGIGRFLVGFGSAFAWVSTMKLGSVWLPRKYFSVFVGLAYALGMLGAIFGEVILAIVVDNLGWQKAVVYSAAVGIFLTVAIWLLVRDQPKTDLNENVQMITFKQVLTQLVKLCRDKNIWLNGCIGGLALLPLAAFAELWGTHYLEYGQNLSHVQAAAADSFVFLGWAFGAPLVGLWSTYINSRLKPFKLCMFITTLILVTILYVDGLPYYAVTALLFLLGFFASAGALSFSIARELSLLATVGTSIALTNMIIMLSGVIYQPLIGSLLDMVWDGSLSAGAPIYTVANYQFALSVIPISTLIAFGLCYCLRETYQQ